MKENLDIPCTNLANPNWSEPEESDLQELIQEGCKCDGEIGFFLEDPKLHKKKTSFRYEERIRAS